ncbi:MAG: heparan-alpha-glucosaminide N-acetyltransferase domain-containing protein [Actinomycetota bacterium]
MNNSSQGSSIHWIELDALRGLAALLMIVNHLGVKTLAPNAMNSPLGSTILLISSFAPVVFFFVTGVGYGLQSQHRKKGSHWYATLNKVAVLVLADLLMPWSEGRWLGLDFLGFIALSSLVLEVVRHSKSPIAYCVTGFIAISLLRYLFGPFLHDLGADRQVWGLSWVLGTSDTPGVSYPMSPWLAYPFAGYLLGSAAMRYQGFVESRRWRVVSSLFILALFPLSMSLVMASRGASFFRWGTVAFGFYLASFAVLSVCLAVILSLCGTPRLKAVQDAVSLRGIASLAVVPVHYFLIYWLATCGIQGLDLFPYFLLAIPVLVASFLLARAVENLSRKLRQVKNLRALWLSLVAMFLLAAGLTLVFSHGDASVVMFTKTWGQLVLCLLFVVRWF